MSAKKVFAWGCGIAAFLGLAAIANLAIFVAYVSKDVQGAGISIQKPDVVELGQVFDVAVTVTNMRPKKPLGLTDIDIHDSFMEGFVVNSVDPPAKSSMHVPIDNSLSYTFDSPIAAGGSRTFKFTLRAEKAGIHGGSVDVCEGSRSISTTIQVSVRDKKE